MIIQLVSSTRVERVKYFLLTILGLVLLLSSSFISAKSYEIAIQPILPEAEIKRVYQPLVDYLSEATGDTFSIKTYRNFLTYWERMKKQVGFDFVLDAAHFTDWRIKRQNYNVLAKFPDSVSFSLVTREDNLVFDAEELVLAKIATMTSPGLGAVRLNEIYSNPMRIPRYMQSKDAVSSVKKVIDGKADAAIIPTPLMGAFEGLNLVETTQLVPHMGFSASSEIPEDVFDKVKRALVDATKTVDGRKMLRNINIEYFEKANNATYDGYAVLLQDVFGY